MVKSDKSTENKKHEDRELATKTAFETTSVDIQTPQTMIILLESKEDMVVLKALSVLDRYASRLERNSQVLHESGIVSKIIPLLTHELLFIKRFATKILSELSFLAPVADILIKEEFVLYMMQLLHDTEDLVVKEFSSSIVAELTKYTLGHAQLLKSNLINTLFTHLHNPDPDIKKNCLQIIINLTQDYFDLGLLTSQPDLSVKVFIDLLNSEYIAIQNLSLDILNVLTQQVKGNAIPKDFQDNGGVTKLLSILKNFEWKDIHEKCLDILGNVYSDPDIAKHFLKDGILQLFNYMKIINDPVMRKKAMDVISKITQTTLGRKVLAESGNITEMAEMILENNAGITSAVCSGVSQLTQDFDALNRILECNTVMDLLTVLSEEDWDWEDKSAAASALYNILRRDINSCHMSVNSDKSEVFENILNQFNEDIPIHAAINIANCVTTMAGIPELTKKIVTRNLISSLLNCFKDFKKDTTTLKLAACEALCSLLNEPRARGFMLSLHGLPAVWKSITKHPNNLQLLQAAATFVHLCVGYDAAFTATLLQLDVLNWLLSQKNLRYNCPAWETALETVLNKFLPLKFAVTGRLEFTDITDSGFYITKLSMSREQLNNNKFPILNDLCENNCCPINTIYVANFGKLEIPQISRSSTMSLKSVFSSPHHSQVSGNESISTSNTSFRYDTKFLLNDVYLQEYIETLKIILKKEGCKMEFSNKNVLDESTITKKAMVVGKFVADQMMGKDQSETCSVHTLDLHINELKMELMNSIIPVGYMRVGMHLERALLFKVLADRVGLPSSLVRGPLGRSWVEVALPALPPTPRPAYPSHLLQPTHLVDLMSSPGTLYPLHSFQADQYCGLV